MALNQIQWLEEHGYTGDAGEKRELNEQLARITDGAHAFKEAIEYPTAARPEVCKEALDLVRRAATMMAAELINKSV